MENSNKRALVVLSGGQDSVTCLGVALAEYEEVHAISFQYGQRHSVELDCAAKICQTYGVPLKLVDVSFFGTMVKSALTSDGEVSAKHESNEALPASFVPNRNALFLTLAHAYAQTIDACAVYTGVCQTDYSGYPDCRDTFIQQLEKTLNTGSERSISFVTPLMFLTKAETFKLAEVTGFLNVVIVDSHTCYEGDRSIEHAWGKGCGVCPSCLLRAKGWDEYMDMLDYESQTRGQ